MGVSVVGASMPIFWWGLMAILLFAVTLGWTPISGRISDAIFVEPVTGFMLIDCWYSTDAGACVSAARHLIVPAIVLGTVPLAVVARVTRSAMLEVLNKDYFRTARAKGLSAPRVVVIHTLRNALIPVVTVIGLQVGSLLSGGRTLASGIGAAPRLSGVAGRRAADRHAGDAGQSRRQPDLRAAQSQDPPLMSETALATPAAAPRPSGVILFWRSFTDNRCALIGLAIMGLLLLLAGFADVIAPHSPIEQFREHFLTPPAWRPRGAPPNVRPSHGVRPDGCAALTRWASSLHAAADRGA